MINFRFHLVSLIAVFLALAVGVVMGYGVLGQPTVEGLQNRIDRVEARANDIKRENDVLEEENTRLQTVIGDVGQWATLGLLRGTEVTTVAVRGISSDEVTAVVEALRRAGATVPGVLWLEDRWALRDSEDAQALASVLGLPQVSSRSALREAGWKALADRLSTSAPTGGRADILTALAGAGFLQAEPVGNQPFDVTGFDGAGATVLAITGTGAAIPARQVLPALARSFVAARAPVMVAQVFAEEEGGPARNEAIDLVLDDGSLNASVATVDNLETPAGKVVAVLALADLGQSRVWHLGESSAADRPSPEPRTR
jgi:hypothetical protein